MKEILKEGYSKIEVEKSKFISYAFFVKNLAEVNYFLKKIEKEHQKLVTMLNIMMMVNQAVLLEGHYLI